MRHRCNRGLVVKNQRTLRGAIVMVTVVLVHIVQSWGDGKTTMTGTEGWMIAEDVDRMRGNIGPDEEATRGRDRDRGHRRTGGLEANGTSDVRGHQIMDIEKSGGDLTRYGGILLLDIMHHLSKISLLHPGARIVHAVRKRKFIQVDDNRQRINHKTERVN